MKKHGPHSPTYQEEKHRADMELGSKRLLARLWIAHPRIMRHLNAELPHA